MKVEYIEETSVRKALAFEVERETVDQEIESRAREYAKKAKIPGFRPGKIPVAVVKTRFKAAVLEEAAEAVVNRLIWKEIEDRGLKPLASPKVADLKIDEGQGMTFRAVFETLPIFELPDHRGLQVEAARPQVSEEHVDREVDRMREDAARYDPVEGRSTRAGDHVVLDLQWTRGNGESGREESALLEVGGADNHADLNAGLLDLSPGDRREIKVVYGADHPQLGGETVTYAFTLKSIKDKVVPAADDEFARDLDHESLAELRGKVRERIQTVADAHYRRHVNDQLVERFMEKVTFDVPEALVDRHLKGRVEDAARELMAQGLDPREGVDWAKFAAERRDGAVLSAKADVVLDALARREGVSVSDAEVDAEIGRVALRLKKPVEVVRARLEKDHEVDGIRFRIRWEKTLDLLRSAAVITEGK